MLSLLEERAHVLTGHWLRAATRDASPSQERTMKDTTGAAMHWWEPESWKKPGLENEEEFLAY